MCPDNNFNKPFTKVARSAISQTGNQHDGDTLAGYLISVKQSDYAGAMPLQHQRSLSDQRVLRECMKNTCEYCRIG
jgi:hypothetical protein